MSHSPIWLRRPTALDLGALVKDEHGMPLSYAYSGMTRSDQPPPGFRVDRAELSIGEGRKTFESAVQYLRSWQVHEKAGIVVEAGGSVQVDSEVLLVVHVALGHVTLACRVVYTVDADDRWGFAYGTLDHHVESGEELFLVELDAQGQVNFRVTSYSRSGHILTAMLGPVARRMQHAATLRYLRGLKSLVDPSGAPRTIDRT